MTREERIKIAREKLRDRKYGLSKTFVKWGAVATVMLGGSMNTFQQLSAASGTEKNVAAAEINTLEQKRLKDSLLQNKELFTQFCDMRSSILADSLLSRAQEVQFEVKSKGRKVLQQRWGKDVHLGLHCIRSGLEILKEAVNATGNQEFYDGFVKAIEDINPNGCSSAMQAYGKSPNYETSRRLGARLQEETRNNPHDIFMVVHESKTETGSGYHFVLVAGEKVISFNRERIEDIPNYFRGSSANPASVINKGHLMNITKEVSMAAAEIQKAAYAACVEEYFSLSQSERDALVTDYLLNEGEGYNQQIRFSSSIPVSVIDLRNAENSFSPEKKELFTAMSLAVDNVKRGSMIAQAKFRQVQNIRNSRS